MVHLQGAVFWSLNSKEIQLEVFEHNTLEIGLSIGYLSPFLVERLQVGLEVDFILDNKGGGEFLQIISNPPQEQHGNLSLHPPHPLLYL